MEENPIPKAEPDEEKQDDLEPVIHIDLPSTPLENRHFNIPPLDDFITSGLVSSFATSALGITLPFIDPSKRECLRAWWHNLLREYGRFYCYGVFLILEADTEAYKYVTDYALELNQASGKNCAILGLGNISEGNSGDFDKLDWSIAAYHQLREGNSLKIAELFHIPLTHFPGLILFRDIRSPEYILIKLKGLTAEEIAEKMRGVYQAINQAADAKKDPLDALRALRRSDEYRGKTRSIISGTRKIAGQTLETVIEAIIKAIVQ